MRRSTLLLALAGLCLVLSVRSTSAQVSATYDLSWHVVAGGGATSAAGGAYALGGTIGQAAAAPSSEGAYTLAAGFWAGVGGTSGSVYLPLLVR